MKMSSGMSSGATRLKHRVGVVYATAHPVSRWKASSCYPGLLPTCRRCPIREPSKVKTIASGAVRITGDVTRAGDITGKITWLIVTQAPDVRWR